MLTTVQPLTVVDQYILIKAETPGSLLLMRRGDAYRAYFGDALTISKELGLTISRPDLEGRSKVPMCGFPYHAMAGYLAKLVREGHRVAVCDSNRQD